MPRVNGLRPTKKHRVMDLLKAAGVNVRDWAHYKGGPRRARANPKYCYEWAFVEPGTVVVLNLWHKQIDERDGAIVADINIREHARGHSKTAKAVWVLRAQRMDRALQTAFIDKLPVRVVVLDGDARRWDDPDAKASSVHQRELDPAVWGITSYEPGTGQALLTRGNAASAAVPKSRILGPWPRPDPRSENAAVRYVTKHLVALGYSVRSVEREWCGYDLHAVRTSGELHVEVKGCAGSVARFFLSRTELGRAAIDRDWRLAVVTGAYKSPELSGFWDHDGMRDSFELEPTQWEGRTKP